MVLLLFNFLAPIFHPGFGLFLNEVGKFLVTLPPQERGGAREQAPLATWLLLAPGFCTVVLLGSDFALTNIFLHGFSSLLAPDALVFFFLSQSLDLCPHLYPKYIRLYLLLLQDVLILLPIYFLAFQ